jgi:hypothetical protein
MNLQANRWLFAPLRQLRTRALMRRHGPTMPYDTAWALITLHSAPEESTFLRAWVQENPGGPPGVHYDFWNSLSQAEQQRRQTWLRRHGRSPVQLLQLEASLILSTGLHVLDWSPLPEHTTQRARAKRHRQGRS